MPIVGVLRTSAQTAAIVVSTAVVGGSIVGLGIADAASGAGKAVRSSLPLAVSGKAASDTNCAGIA
ncbi:hypothetical protein [Sphingomonas aurantiaca]|uniref:hypothetical protein n=1 Tax=Sphingomonas aurantiaca TaxID=185949 RepID=UPI0033495CC6